ncbi:2-oxo-3-hexenedioate decarboxylase [Agromyces sp. CF514]|uniref:2-keto-4-pentenoate hydratase n=1 Tax=Agromyces sp. CF514 TaxID=1881031 RepID=UPI0008E5CEB2|nr:fumarylacetoacetate hydrolase family protein [Agromyces sp. CF514]SFR69548.1 2-oxo-3-hexenedioate decarboxylase [Agromyces sp. CF514]
MTAAAAFAAALDRAQRTTTPITNLAPDAAIGLGTAYAAQHALIARRLARGERVTGVKLGFTSRAKAAQMGVDDVIIGTLTDAMRIEDGGTFDVRSAIHPRIEPEVAYLLGVDLDPLDDGPADPATADLLAAIAAVAPALEVIDSRYRDFRFSLDDVVADNASAAAYAIGPWRRPAEAGPLGNRAVRLELDGRLAQTGSTSAILGDPARAVAAARRLARLHGFVLPAGSVLLAGAATAAVPLAGHSLAEATVAGLGHASLRVAAGPTGSADPAGSADPTDPDRTETRS